MLARVDVVCLDKTGTITEGSMQLADVDVLGPSSNDTNGSSVDSTADDDGGLPVDGALAAIAWADPNPNATQLALQERYPRDSVEWTATANVPFSSARKWSASSFEGHGSWVLGAAEMVLGDDLDEAVRSKIESASRNGQRVLLLAHSDTELGGERLPDGVAPAALVMIEDRIREDAPETLAYFADQDVTLKVISGDNPVTVGAVAARAGLEDADNVTDARTLPEDDQERLANVVEATTVFGRVTPHQKRAMVAALQSRDHVVAMTGDGVNDVLALKDADVGHRDGVGIGGDPIGRAARAAGLQLRPRSRRSSPRAGRSSTTSPASRRCSSTRRCTRSSSRGWSGSAGSSTRSCRDTSR